MSPTPEQRRHARRERRGGPDPRLLPAAAFVLGVLLTAGVALVLSGTSGDSPSDRGTEAGDAARSASGNVSPSPLSLTQNERRALMTKPLAQLARGDRVVYNLNACRFRHWVGDGRDVALIACPGARPFHRPFQVRTEYLVPVELGGD